MRKALIVGIDYYEHVAALSGCVNDAHSVRAILERHGDGTINFDVKSLTGTGPADLVTRASLKDHIVELFKGGDEIALFYFAGHGHIETAGGYIVASDAKRGDDGISLGELIAYANQSEAKNNIIVLDSCHSGIIGTPAGGAGIAEITEGTTLLTASTADQYATEENGHGVFSVLFVDALVGAAANLVGEITPGSIYAHIDQSLGSWEQRPVFKTNVKNFVSVRKVAPPISLTDLRRITELFPHPGVHFPLDPTFEPEMKGRDAGMPAPIPENTQKFKILQSYNRVGLLVPVDVPNMWNAAMESKSCKLTVLGIHYHRLVLTKRI